MLIDNNMRSIVKSNSISLIISILPCESVNSSLRSSNLIHISLILLALILELITNVWGLYIAIASRRIYKNCHCWNWKFIFFTWFALFTLSL